MDKLINIIVVWLMLLFAIFVTAAFVYGMINIFQSIKENIKDNKKKRSKECKTVIDEFKSAVIKELIDFEEKNGVGAATSDNFETIVYYTANRLKENIS